MRQRPHLPPVGRQQADRGRANASAPAPARPIRGARRPGQLRPRHYRYAPGPFAHA
ncbi:hypothetical protein [Lysobacter gummosus]|uniref:hypothetical protein n=1 Tax=Lysobacter gummosus TaxID=262324 RepID=UPI0036302D02